MPSGVQLFTSLRLPVGCDDMCVSLDGRRFHFIDDATSSGDTFSADNFNSMGIHWEPAVSDFNFCFYYSKAFRGEHRRGLTSDMGTAEFAFVIGRDRLAVLIESNEREDVHTLFTLTTSRENPESNQNPAGKMKLVGQSALGRLIAASQDGPDVYVATRDDRKAPVSVARLSTDRYSKATIHLPHSVPEIFDLVCEGGVVYAIHSIFDAQDEDNVIDSSCLTVFSFNRPNELQVMQLTTADGSKLPRPNIISASVDKSLGAIWLLAPECQSESVDLWRLALGSRSWERTRLALPGAVSLARPLLHSLPSGKAFLYDTHDDQATLLSFWLQNVPRLSMLALDVLASSFQQLHKVPSRELRSMGVPSQYTEWL